MAKATFHKAQRVYVRPVGTHAIIERIVPYWAKGVDEPIKVSYDVGLGRPFLANELEPARTNQSDRSVVIEQFSLHQTWRIQRNSNRVSKIDECEDHPVPGTHPVVQTDENGWGGWRVPTSEYNRDPDRIEFQARMIMNSPALVRLCRSLIEMYREDPDSFPVEAQNILKDAAPILRHVYDVETQAKVAAE